mmetsp:Transcript_17154/g.48214  ORF Transcript_17154/g.48214 Transcript_17154/m.48214 type:complete len:200 (-) Transcript_17154:420-1019(-)
MERRMASSMELKMAPTLACSMAGPIGLAIRTVASTRSVPETACRTVSWSAHRTAYPTVPQKGSKMALLTAAKMARNSDWWMVQRKVRRWGSSSVTWKVHRMVDWINLVILKVGRTELETASEMALPMAPQKGPKMVLLMAAKMAWNSDWRKAQRKVRHWGSSSVASKAHRMVDWINLEILKVGRMETGTESEMAPPMAL